MNTQCTPQFMVSSICCRNER